MSRFILEIACLVLSGLFGGALLKSSYSRVAGLALLAWIPVRLTVWFFPDWTINLGWNWLFWLVLLFGVAALVVSLVFDSGNFRMAVRVIGTILLAWVLIGGLVGMNFPSFNDKNSASSVAGPKPSPTATTPKVDEFTIALPKRTKHRLNAAGVDPEKRGNAEAFRDQITEQAKHDPLTLFLYYQASPLGKTQPLTNESVLAKDGKIVNGNVYSKQGRKVYQEWSAMWNSPLTKIKAVKEIKFQGVNTGVNGTKTTQSSGVGGKDKSGYDIAYVNAQGETVGQHSALNRCTQPTGKTRVPGVPHGPTDNPPPPKKCPYNPSLPPDSPKCLQPKSGDASDYPYPSGKPPVTAPGSGESTPPKVNTSQPGGGGVVDSPTNDPGSETGGTAPGADPPSDDRDNPPTNEGGGGTGTVTP